MHVPLSAVADLSAFSQSVTSSFFCLKDSKFRGLFLRLRLFPIFPFFFSHFFFPFPLFAPSKAGCSTSEIRRRSFCVWLCPVGIHVARQINNYRVTEYTTLEGWKKRQFLDLLMSNMRETKITLGKKERGEKKGPQLFFVHFLALCWQYFLLLLCLAFVRALKKTVTKAAWIPHQRCTVGGCLSLNHMKHFWKSFPV